MYKYTANLCKIQRVILNLRLKKSKRSVYVHKSWSKEVGEWRLAAQDLYLPFQSAILSQQFIEHLFSTRFQAKSTWRM